MSTDHVVRLDELLSPAGPDGAAPPTTLAVPVWADAPAPAPRVRRGDDGVSAAELAPVGDPGAAASRALGGRSSAWAAGYRDGHAEGLADGRAEGLAQGRLDGADLAVAEATRRVASLADVVAAALDEQDRRLRALAGEVVELAVELASAVVGHHVAAVADPGADALRRAVDAAPAGRPLLARLHPDDVAALSADPAALAPGRRLEVVADPAVARGDCLLEAGPTTVDASLSAALGRVRAVLSEPSP